MKYLYAVLLSGLLVCGCGQKGALFLPGDRSEMQTELPEVDREALERELEGAMDDEDDSGEEDADHEEPDRSGDEEPEPLYDPSAPPENDNSDSRR